MPCKLKEGNEFIYVKYTLKWPRKPRGVKVKIHLFILDAT